MKTFIVKSEDEKKRLDIFLSEQIAQSRSSLQQVIKDELVLVNKSAAKANYRIKAGDQIEMLSIPKAAKKVPLELVEQIRIIDETEDYLIIDKPAGLLVHQAADPSRYTLADWLAGRFKGIENVGESPKRPGIVHRLDRDVSGLMVVAKNNQTYNWLKQQFKSRRVKKIYKALVFGRLTEKEVVIDFPIERSSSGHKMAAKPLNQTGRSALTEVKVAQDFVNYTLVSVRIKTGRTHQIRAHLAAYNHPIVGDYLYGTSATTAKNEKLGLKRLFLAAVELGFTDVSGEQRSYSIELPEKLTDFLTQIK